MAASSSSSSSLIPPQRGYDVFLSFRGKDTRNKFTSHLFASLERHRFRTFRDDKRLEKGEDITPELLKAIEDSRISIVIFSKNYAESSWCLNELLKIMECKKVLQQMVLPIFYDIDPSEVRKQKGSFEEAFALHEERFREVSDGKVEKWRETLTDAATLSGWDLQNEANRDEAKVIEEIIQEVGKKLNLAHLYVADHPVGLDRQVQELETLLSMESNDVHIVAVWGIGGIGKTIIAKELYNRIHHKFKGSSFLANVRENSKQPNDVVELQNQLLSDIVRNDTLRVRNTDQGIELLKQRAFYHRKVLLVLDDVDDDKQLKALAINRSFFHPGSRIIITTRYLSSRSSLEMDETYEPKGLYEDESRELFSWHAFKEDRPKEDFKELSEQVVRYARGLPLTLEVLGSFLSRRSKSEWESAIKKISKIPHNDVQGKLKISFDKLTLEEQDLFLVIAFFFVGKDRDFTYKILEGRKMHPEIEVPVLIDRCLVKIKGNKLVMHDVIRDMGREIVRQESVKEAGKRSRLCDYEDIFEVLRDGTGSEAVEGIFLNLPKPSRVQVDVDAFEKMNRLWLLHLNNVQLSVGYENINSKRLLWLSWKGFPLKCMSSNLSMENLVALDLSYSSLIQVWKGTKILNKLKFLYLSHCYYLTNTPDFSGLKSLEELWLNDCTSLVEVDESIKCLSKLLVLNLENCKNLRNLPPECLDLSGCSKLVTSVGFRGSPSKSHYSLLTKSVDESIGYLTCLRKLFIGGNNLLTLPDSIGNLVCLQELRCTVSHLPSEIGKLISLEWLDLFGSDICSLPDSISNLTRLVILNLIDCERLQSLPKLPGLEELFADNCTSLEEIIFGSMLGSLSLPDCHKLVERKFGNDFRQIFHHKELFEREEPIDILVSGIEFPNWLPYQSTGSSLSFLVPPPPRDNVKILGLLVFVVGFARYMCDYYIADMYFKFLFHNKTMGDSERDKHRQVYHPVDNVESWMCLSYLPLCFDDMLLESGDEVEMKIELQIETKDEVDIVLEKCGICPIYEVENSNFNSQSRRIVIYEGDDGNSNNNSPTQSKRIVIYEGDDGNSNNNSPRKRRVVIDQVDDDILQEEEEELQ